MTISEIYNIIFSIENIILGGIALKALCLGSDFSFWDFYRHGNKYLEWYDSRPKFQK